MADEETSTPEETEVVVLADTTGTVYAVPRSVLEQFAVVEGVSEQLTRAADADWLRACVWPDQADRFDRLDRALAVAAVDPPPIVRGDLVDDLRATVARLDPDAHLVVTASWVLNYLDAERRRAFVDTLDAVAADRDLTWCAAESPTLTAELPWPAGVADHDRAHLTHLLRVDWRAGHRTVAHLAVAHPHGYWLHWA